MNFNTVARLNRAGTFNISMVGDSYFDGVRTCKYAIPEPNIIHSNAVRKPNYSSGFIII